LLILVEMFCESGGGLGIADKKEATVKGVVGPPRLELGTCRL